MNAPFYRWFIVLLFLIYAQGCSKTTVPVYTGSSLAPVLQIPDGLDSPVSGHVMDVPDMTGRQMTGKVKELPRGDDGEILPPMLTK